MKALVKHRSLRQRLSWWLALQSFAGLGLVCLAVYLVTQFNFRDRQEETLAQKENVIRHLLVDGKEHGDSEDLAHKLDDFLVGHRDLSLEVAQADGAVLYAHTRNQNANTVWRQRQFEVAQSAGQTPSKSLRVRLSLQADQVPPLRLGGRGEDRPQLGWNTWLRGRRSQSPTTDTEFHFSAMGGQSWH